MKNATIPHLLCFFEQISHKEGEQSPLIPLAKGGLSATPLYRKLILNTPLLKEAIIGVCLHPTHAMYVLPYSFCLYINYYEQHDCSGSSKSHS